MTSETDTESVIKKAICACESVPFSEAAMVSLQRDMTGKPTIWCDPCIADLVNALNQSGFATVASCCGHKTKPGWIALKDGRVLVLADDIDMSRSMIEHIIGADKGDASVAKPAPSLDCEQKQIKDLEIESVSNEIKAVLDLTKNQIMTLQRRATDVARLVNTSDPHQGQIDTLRVMLHLALGGLHFHEVKDAYSAVLHLARTEDLPLDKAARYVVSFIGTLR